MINIDMKMVFEYLKETMLKFMQEYFLQGLLLLGFNNLDYKFSSIKEHQKK